MNWLVLTGLVLGLLVAAVVPAFLRPILTHLGVVDVPNERSSHARPTLRGGGVGPLVGILVGGGVVAAGLIDSRETVPFVAVVLSAAVMGVVGAVEDLRGLDVTVRAGSQLLVGAFATIGLGAFVGAPGWVIIGGVVFFAAYVNFANFMDGINGISGLCGGVAGGAFAVIGVIQDHSWLVAAGLLMAVVFAAFLPWNLLPPGMFLGDVGSYLLGGFVAVTAIAAAFAGVPLLTVLAPLSICLVDTVSALVRRASRGEAVLSAHRTHAYQRLTDTGLSHVQVSILVAGLSALNAGLGIAAMRGGPWFWGALGLVGFVCALYLLLPRFRGNRLPARPVRRIGPIEQPRGIAPREGFRPLRFAVVGATGFVGSALIAHLRAQDLDVVAVRAPRVRLSPQSHDPYEIASGSADPIFDADLAAMIGRVDVVINAAGLATPDAIPSEDLYGANALLPVLIARAAEVAGVRRVIHLSSAAVQGRRAILDESLEASPFSPYSRSKALGERAFLVSCRGDSAPDLIVIRATSVQGPGRGTTESLRRIARSPLASVAGAGRQSTVVSSIDGLIDFVTGVAQSERSLGSVMLQPWEGLSAADVLRIAGGRAPHHLPVVFCRMLVMIVRAVGVVVPEIAGAGRRLELMWMGQRQTSSFSHEFPAVERERLEHILAGCVYSEAGSGAAEA
ncbi:NAD-dependent epimerase/dehydratase family protein [Microbacterium xylanilyticum]